MLARHRVGAACLTLLLSLALHAADGMCQPWCAVWARQDRAYACTQTSCSSCGAAVGCFGPSPPPPPPQPPDEPPPPLPPPLPPRPPLAGRVNHDFPDALRKSLLFFRAQRSGNLTGTANPVVWRTAPSFTTDGADVGADLSRGYFDAGDYVKYGQPAAYTMSILAWSGLEFASGLRAAGAFDELKQAVRWGTDFILEAATHLDETDCTYFAQVGRGAAERCGGDACKFDHGYWGRPEDYHASYAYASQRQTYAVDSARPGIEIWASASAALSAAHLLLRDDEGAYAARLLKTSKTLFACAADPRHNPSNDFLQHAGLPEVAPQYAPPLASPTSSHELPRAPTSS